MRLKTSIPLLLLALFLSPAADAADSGKVSLGLATGFSFPSPGSTTVSYGIEGGAHLFGSIKSTLFLHRYTAGIEATDGTNSVTASSSTLLIGVKNHFTLFQSILIGPAFGYLMQSASVTATNTTSTVSLDTSTSAFFLGPTIGYDFSLGGGKFSVGPEFNYLYAFSSSAPKILQLLAILKYNL